MCNCNFFLFPPLQDHRKTPGEGGFHVAQSLPFLLVSIDCPLGTARLLSAEFLYLVTFTAVLTLMKVCT